MKIKLSCFAVLLALFSANLTFGQNRLVSVNPVTGTANVVIPMYSLSRGQVSLPISLTYSGTGVKPKDVEGTGGMGWNVQAGGQITREVRGLPDDCTTDGASAVRDGWLYSNTSTVINEWTITNTNNSCAYETTDLDYINNYFSYSKDTEPDVFYVSAPGLSCEFVFDGSQNVKLLSYQDLQITHTYSTTTGPLDGAITSFTIINDQGIKYVFASPEITTQATVLPHGGGSVTYFENYYSQYENGIEFYNNWHLTSMTDANGNGFTFNYTSGINRASVDSVHLYISGADNDTSSYRPYVVEQATTPYLLSSIYPVDNASTGAGYQPISFTWASNNGTGGTYQSCITSITGLGRTLELTYSPVVYTSAGGTAYTRYFLRSYTEPGANSPVNYQFSYFGETYVSVGAYYKTNLSDSVAYADAWGFYNSLPKTALPALYVNPGNPAYQRYEIWNSTSSGSDYTYLLNSLWPISDANYVMTGSLTGITTAKGGTTTITYQSNDYLDVPAGVTVVGGGVRVKQITDNDNISAADNIVRSYTYINPTTGLSSGEPITMPVFGFTTPYAGSDTGLNLWYSATIRSANDLSMEDHTIMYQYVQESTGGMGSVQYQYYVPATNWDSSAAPDCTGCATEWTPTQDYTARTNCFATYGPVRNDIDTYPFAYNPNYDFERGLIKQVIVYNTSALKVSEMDYTYQRTSAPTVITAVKFDYNTNSSGGSIMGYAKYNILANTSELTSTVTKIVYDSNLAGQSQTSTTNYSYNSTQHKLNQVQVTNSDNNVYTTHISYTKDYTATGSSNADVQAINNLQQQNINIPVETYQQATINGGSPLTTAAALTRYQTQTVNGDTFTMPVQQLKYVAADGTAAFTPYAITSGTPSSFSGYLPVANYTSYDQTALLQTSADGSKNEATSVTDHTSYRPIAVFKDAAQPEIAYNDFDSYFASPSPALTVNGTGTSPVSPGHTGNGLSITTANSFSGTLTKNPAAQNDIVSVWVNATANGGFTISMTPSGGSTTNHNVTYLATGGQWVYYEYKIPLTGITTTYGISITPTAAVSVDDLLVYPDDAEVNTTAYDKTAYYPVAQTSTNGISAYFTNDTWGRNLYAYDRDLNIRQKNTYVTPQEVTDFNNAAILYLFQPVQNAPTYYYITGVDNTQGATATWTFGSGSSPVTVPVSTQVPYTYTLAGPDTVTAVVSAPYLGTRTITSYVTVGPGNVYLSYASHTTGYGVISSVIFTSTTGGTNYTFTTAQLNSGHVLNDSYNIEVVLSGAEKYPYPSGGTGGYTSVSVAGGSYSGCQAYVISNMYYFNGVNLTNTTGIAFSVSQLACP